MNASAALPLSRALQTAELKLSTRPFCVSAKVEVTPSGLLAIGALVAGILCATAVVVHAARH